MNKIEQLEINTARSFQLAKTDIIALHTEIASMKRSYLDLARKFIEVNQEVTRLRRKPTMKKISVRKASPKRKFVASKAAAKVHSKACYFGKNIKPKNKRVFASKNSALNAGYKLCDCLN
ncbi:hypothetical protein HOI26_04220 [Candidatus Woesearchaeota archaeon]|mgnify:FL=1|jgi:hypothetical protein|nr:hypothetical protein [Candidatus Woesearchaeota archaeon]MBT5740282.1 hypothetical protein [Candidatus Woesearchaeota archaeon]